MKALKGAERGNEKRERSTENFNQFFKEVLSHLWKNPNQLANEEGRERTMAYLRTLSPESAANGVVGTKKMQQLN